MRFEAGHDNRMKNLQIAVLLICATASIAVPAAVDREQSRRFYEEALEFLRGESLGESVIQLRNALQQDPDNLPARITLGRVLLRQDQPLAAIKELEKAHAMGGDENLILVPLATAYLEIAKPEQVITGFVASGHRPQVDGELQLLQADASLQLGDKKSAEEFYLSAGTLLPVDPRPILGRAKLALIKGKRDKAQMLLDEAVQLAPESFVAWLFKSIFHRDHQQYEQATKAFEKTLELEPTSGRALTARAAMWMDLGQTDKAKSDLKQVRNLGGETLEAVYLRTLLMFRDGRGDEAREALRERADEIRALKDQYRDKMPTTKLMLGVVAFFETNYDEAISQLKSFLGSFPGHLGAKRYLASAYLSIGEYKQVIRLYKPKVQESPPRDPMALALLAEAYRAVGNFESAETYFESAISLAPGIAGIGVRLAGARLDAGKPDEAIADLERLTGRFPDLVDAWMQLARVHMKKGDIASAKEVAKEVLQRFGDDPLVHNLVGGIYLAAGEEEAASTELRLASEMDPDLLLPRLNLARVARMRNEFASAEAQYRAVLQRFPRSTVANLELARLLLRAGDIKEAMERVDDIMRVEPLLFAAHELKLRILERTERDDQRLRNTVYELVTAFPDEPSADLIAGDVYRRTGSLADAKIHYRHAVEKAEFDVDVLYPAAERQLGISDYRGALWSLTKAEQGAPGLKKVGVLKVAVLTQLKEFERAHELVAELVAKHGETAAIHTVAGDLLMAQRRLPEAVMQYQQAYARSPVFKALQAYFRALVAADDAEKARELIAGWLKKRPRDLAASHLYAQLLMKEKDYETARTMYERIQSLGREDIVLLNNLANAYQHLDDPRALPTAEAAYNLAPENAQVVDTYGWILTENGRVDEGLALLRDAYARSSTSPAIRYHIGLALARKGRVDEAAEEVEAALSAGERFSARDAAATLLRDLKGRAN